MSASLQKGINAAKAGHMDNALDFLKDAIIEEPQNADVWVWIAAIIDDLDKQEFFLEKALEIEPNNIPAQRGLAYLQKRKRDQAVENSDHLSDHTRPISPFPNSKTEHKSEQFSGWTNVSPSEILEFQQASEHKSEPNDQRDPNKLTPFEIVLLSVVVIVFCIIGLLAASAIFDFELPISFLSSGLPAISAEPPYPGVFLYESDAFINIEENEGLPTSDSGIPTSKTSKPLLALWRETEEAETFKLIFQNGDYIPVEIYPGFGESDIIQPVEDLVNGLYCLQYEPPAQEENALYWCFNVVLNGETD